MSSSFSFSLLSASLFFALPTFPFLLFSYFAHTPSSSLFLSIHSYHYFSSSSSPPIPPHTVFFSSLPPPHTPPTPNIHTPTIHPRGVLSAHLHDFLATDENLSMHQATSRIAVFGAGAAFGVLLGRELELYSGI